MGAAVKATLASSGVEPIKVKRRILKKAVVFVSRTRLTQLVRKEAEYERIIELAGEIEMLPVILGRLNDLHKNPAQTITTEELFSRLDKKQP